MTELERQLTAALRKLSAQYETQQRRRAGRSLAAVSSSRPAANLRIVQLSGHVTGLDADYKTIAATLREW